MHITHKPQRRENEKVSKSFWVWVWVWVLIMHAQYTYTPIPWDEIANSQREAVKLKRQVMSKIDELTDHANLGVSTAIRALRATDRKKTESRIDLYRKAVKGLYSELPPEVVTEALDNLKAEYDKIFAAWSLSTAKDGLSLSNTRYQELGELFYAEIEVVIDEWATAESRLED